MSTLKRWKIPDDYAGPEWPDYFVACGHHRDSEEEVDARFYGLLEKLGGESETVKVIREWHWLVGWVEWIGIHESDTKSIEIAELYGDEDQ